MNAEKVYELIQNAKIKANRIDKISFVAVSKTRSFNEIKEAEAKRTSYGASRLQWRLIGHL